jgi:ATP-dependent DNA helicase RecG
MRKDEIASSLEETGIISHELLPVLKASIKNLDNEKLIDYLQKTGLPTKIDEAILLETGIIVVEKDFDHPHPTFGGILLFGKNPEVFLPHCVIRIHNSYNPKFPVHYVAKGTVMDMLADGCEFIKNCLEDLEFPFEIIEEHLAKSILFRDYFDINNCIEIYITKKNIEILNPGAAVKREENEKEKYVKRNMWLYLKLIAIDNEHKYFNKNFNSYQILKGKIRIKYLNIIAKNLFKVIIPLNFTIKPPEQ